MMRVSLYARVSTLDKGQDPDMQLRELREYCQRRGWAVCKEYVDRGVSGSKESRPELNRMMVAAAKREFDAVVVWRFDRFARSTSHLLRALGEFDALGIAFVSLTEAIDTSTPMGKMIFTVLAAVGELERNLIVERVRCGMRNAKAKGKSIGRRRVTVNASQITALRNAGRSWSEVCAETGLSAGTARRAASSLATRGADTASASL
jgi:DNA invertase Pin-like site-specific DNA recombinase